MTIALRDYQEECLTTVLNEYHAGTYRQLVVLPTGSGKTVLMAAIAKQFNKKTLIIAHREELLQQAIDKFKLFWPEVDIGLCKAEVNEIDCQVVVGSIQSCYRPQRLAKLKEQGFDLLMIDEAHHSISDSYQSVINGLGFSESNSSRLLLGVTATAGRDGLGDIFERITFNRSISTMINAGYLAPVVGRKILTNFSLEKIRVQNGDFSVSDLAEAVNTTERNHFIVNKFQEYACDRKSIAFCVDVQHCKDLAAAFKAHGVDCAPVWGDMPPEERKRALSDLKHGRIQVATSCGVLTEGFDESSISCVVMARPTKSQTLYVQSVGRGLRIHPLKENCLVLDFTDLHHNLDSIMNLSSLIPEAFQDEELPESELQEREEIDHTPKITALEEIDKVFDILGRQNFIWTDIGDSELSLQDDLKREIVMQPKESGYVAMLYHADGASEQIIDTPLPLGYCQGVCEDYARRNLKVAFADLSTSWYNGEGPPTKGQREYLENLGAYREGMTKTEAAFELRHRIALKNKSRRKMSFEPLTDKQKYYLNANGIKTENMSKLQAMREISKLKQKVS